MKSCLEKNVELELYNQVWVLASTFADLMYDFDFFPPWVKKKLDYVISKGLFSFICFLISILKALCNRQRPIFDLEIEFGRIQ